MRMIDSLEQKGLARRTVNPDDRRENLLSITERGAEVLSQYKEIEKGSLLSCSAVFLPTRSPASLRWPMPFQEKQEESNPLYFATMIAIVNCL